MGQEYALQTILELPTRGCWQITGNYKGDYRSFVVWNDRVEVLTRSLSDR